MSERRRLPLLAYNRSGEPLSVPLLGDDEWEQLKSERERDAWMPASRRRAIPVGGGQQARHGPEGHGSGQEFRVEQGDSVQGWPRLIRAGGARLP